MARAIVLSETSDSQDVHKDEETQPESEEGEEEVAPSSSSSSRPRVAFCTLDSDENEVRRSLMQRATKCEGRGHVGSVAWQGDGTPSSEGRDSDLSIQDAVRQLAQRYEGPREFWTESSLPTITRDSLPSASAIHSAMPTREQLPVMNGEIQSGHPTHPSSPSSDDDTGPSMMASSESDEPSQHMFQFKRMKKLRRAMMSKESLPTIFSESNDGSELGSQTASRRGSRQVSRCHTREMLPDLDFDLPSGFKARTTTKDSLPPIGDELEPDSDLESDSGPEKEAVAENSASPPCRGPDSMCAADVAEQLRLAQQQISAMRNELDALRRDNADLQHENEVLRTLATKSESLRELAGVANNPKRKPPPALNSHSQGWAASEGRRFSDPGGEPGPVASSDLRRSSESSTLTAKDLWQKRRQERKERLRNADSGGKLSYRRWLQDQHELMAVAPPKNQEECASAS